MGLNNKNNKKKPYLTVWVGYMITQIHSALSLTKSLATLLIKKSRINGINMLKIHEIAITS